MEGLIPMVFKAIKRNKVRRQYRCLSVRAAETYNIADFYDYDLNDKFYTPPPETTRGGFDDVSKGHRRYASAGEFGIDGGYDFSNYDDHHGGGVGRNTVSSPPKQIMKRYRSHRMFSCITGGI